MTVSAIAAAQLACQRIAPVWPLDQSIAVNPWWQLRDKPISEVSALLAVLGQVQCVMPPAYYLKRYREGEVSSHHLKQATESLSVELSETQLVSYLSKPVPTYHWLNISEWLDSECSNPQKMAWHEEVVHQVSQFCALFCQFPERIQVADEPQANLYRAWLALVQQDKGMDIIMGEPGLNQQFFSLPNDYQDLIQLACNELLGADASNDIIEHYCHALLLDINGWASYLAYGTWQEGLGASGSSAPLLGVEKLLAVRLAWELVLWRHIKAKDEQGFALVKSLFSDQQIQLPQLLVKQQDYERYLWVWQRALEYAYQESLTQQLLETSGIHETDNTPELQAAFCIDVRSEPMRRALESQHSGIETFGFAGFFGLPIEYSPTGSDYARPQLPGLLRPTIRASQKVESSSSRHKVSCVSHDMRNQARMKQSFDAAPSSFGLIEAQGILKGFKLLKNSLFPSTPKHSINALTCDSEWVLLQEGQPVSIDAQTELVAGILKGMSLTERFAPRVLLLGHGSASTNNPQAAALDCGACGGQTGEVNAKVLAQLLNDTSIRSKLVKYSIHIPEATQFIAGLHNTTTDEIQCFGLQNSTQEPWQAWLEQATELAQLQRVDSLRSISLEPSSAANNAAAELSARTKAWSQIRPEWGLANNASFIIAPRARTEPLNLQGRSFLHDYHWQNDEGFGVLELLMTAPMVVTNWINLQYYASVTDNTVYGSGNKLLHNVVGGNMGVFEGNGGDLRGGLALQSVHDGREWRHEPLRLSVYIEAPKEAINNILKKHVHVADLVKNEWLFLFQIEMDGGVSRVN